MYLDDIVEAMQRIAQYIEGYSFTQFKQDYKTVDAVIRNLEVIGEASKNVPHAFKKQHQNIPWDEMYYLRNKVAHEYFGIDYEIIWDIITNYLPANLVDVIKIRLTVQDK